MTPVLYGMSSPNVLKVMILFEELDREYVFEHVDLFAKGTAPDEVVARNPNAKVPVLETDEGPIFESGAILLRVAEEAGRFLPEEMRARSEVLQWLFLQVATVGPMLGQLNHFVMYAPAGQDYSTGRYRREAARIYKLLEDRLSDHQYLAGGDYSIADMATLPWTDYMEKHGFDRSDYPALLRWRTALEQRPAIVRARTRMTGVQERDGQLFAGASEEALLRFTGQQIDD